MAQALPMPHFAARTPIFASSHWSMRPGERSAFEGLLAALRPAVAIEIGRAQGGSLERMAVFCDEVHSFDLSNSTLSIEPPANCYLHVGDSRVLLPRVLDELARAGRRVDFALVDGDHTSDGVEHDLRALLDSQAVTQTVIVLHDTGNREVRSGLARLDLSSRREVAQFDLDFVPGQKVEQEDSVYAGELWGGLGVVVVDVGAADRRSCTIAASARPHTPRESKRPRRPGRLERANEVGDTAEARRRAIDWYRNEARPVTVVIRGYRDTQHVRDLVTSIRATTSEKLVRIVIAAAAADERLSGLRGLDGVAVSAGGPRGGFAANANRGLAKAAPDDDVALLDSDVIAEPGWIECLQHRASSTPKAGIVGPKLLYPDGRIESAGTTLNFRAMGQLDSPVGRIESAGTTLNFRAIGRLEHRYRGRPRDWPAAAVPWPAIAMTGGCLYVRREVLERIGNFDESYATPYEDVDMCLRAWRAGFEVLYEPGAELRRLESAMRGPVETPEARLAQHRFWSRWGEFLGVRSVRGSDGALRVDVLAEPGTERLLDGPLDELAAAGHDVVRHPSSADPDALASSLAERDSLKLASGPVTALAAWVGSVQRGIPVYLLSDRELSSGGWGGRDPHWWRGHEPYWWREEFRYLALGPRSYELLRARHLDCWPLSEEPYGDSLEDALLATARPRSVLMSRELQTAQADLATCQAALEAMEQSISWRATEPLRQAKSRLRSRGRRG